MYPAPPVTSTRTEAPYRHASRLLSGSSSRCRHAQDRGRERLLRRERDLGHRRPSTLDEYLPEALGDAVDGHFDGDAAARGEQLALARARAAGDDGDAGR